MYAYVDFRPFLLLAGILIFGVLALLTWIARGRSTRMGATFPLFVVFLLLFAFAFYGPFVGYSRNVTHPMLWKTAPGKDATFNSSHVVLGFRDHPGWEISMYSDDLAAYLQTLPDENVEVEFEVTYDYGNARGFNQVRIGDLTEWRRELGTYSHRGQSPSPF